MSKTGSSVIKNINIIITGNIYNSTNNIKYSVHQQLRWKTYIFKDKHVVFLSKHDSCKILKKGNSLNKEGYLYVYRNNIIV